MLQFSQKLIMQKANIDYDEASDRDLSMQGGFMTSHGWFEKIHEEK